MPDRMPEDLPDRTPEDMPDRMPDRMPEDMSDRMPEDLPVRKCINAMAGIIRSEVFFFDDFIRATWAEKKQKNIKKNHKKHHTIFIKIITFSLNNHKHL
jgi:hypothetical protein